MQFPVLLLACLSAFTQASPVNQPRASLCNGNAALCSRRYSNVTLIGTHDSAFVGSTSDPRVNQEDTVTQQLNAGIRFLQAQTHYFLGQLSMCHTSCIELYAGTLKAYLTPIATWLAANPNEVLTILLTNGDDVGVGNFSAVFKSVGLDKHAFVPSSSPLPINSWPTYAQMIAAGTRLVVFLDCEANTSVAPYILDEFAYFFETPYDTTDPTFPECSIDRPPGASANGRMYIVNHFLDEDVLGIDIPDNGADTTTNSATGTGSIEAQAGICSGLYGRKPNVVLVDMFDRGNVFQAQKDLNGLWRSDESKYALLPSFQSEVLPQRVTRDAQI